MDILLIAVGTSLPDWVNKGFEEYARRLPRECALKLVEIPAAKRTAHADIARITRAEGEKMLAAIPRGAMAIALDADARQWNSEELAGQLDHWLQGGRDIALLVGGPEGLAPACREIAAQTWSLSRLTLPHPLVRVVIAEQLYRAWTIRQGHPYHK